MEIKMASSQKNNPKAVTESSDNHPEQIQNNPSGASIAELGFDEWFESRGAEQLKDGLSAARITEVNRNHFRISDGRRETLAECSGRFLFNAENSADYPTVGDWVAAQVFDGSAAVIHHVLPRKSLLKRKDPGKAVGFQLIAANIDHALILQSADSDFSLNRLERYLVMVHESGIRPVIILTKTDLASADALADIREKIGRLGGQCPFLPVSNWSGEGIQTLRETLLPDRTYCLLGSSGVGKTTLLNTLAGGDRFDTAEVREKDGKGRHTTTRRQLIRLESGSLFIDTPGMRELGNFDADAGIEETFDEIVSLGGKCRFADCTHVHETGCAVKEAVEQGRIDPGRYENYLKLRKESAFYAMSLQDRRKRDKVFGKMLKNYKKTIRKK